MKTIFAYIVLVIFPFCTVHALDCHNDKPPKSAYIKLRKKLFCDYDKTIKPVLNYTSDVEVNVNFHPYYIFIDENKDVVQILGYTLMGWKDEYLTWIPKEFDNITFLSGDNMEIWIPEITSYSKGIKHFLDVDRDFVSRFIRITSEGKVSLNAKVLLTGVCLTDLYNWPFTQAKCTINFVGSPAYMQTEDVIFIYSKNFYDLKHLRKDREWQLVNMSATCIRTRTKPQQVNRTECDFMSYRVVMSRHAKYYIAAFVFPAFLLSVGSLVPLWMKYSISYRLIILLSVFMGQLLYLFGLNMLLLNNGDDGIAIVTFFRDTLCMTTFSILLTFINHGMLTKLNPPPKIITDTLDWVSHLPYIKSTWDVLMDEEEKESLRPVQEDRDDDENLQEMQEEKPAKSTHASLHEWKVITLFLDRVTFLLFLVILTTFWITLIPF